MRWFVGQSPHHRDLPGPRLLPGHHPELQLPLTGMESWSLPLLPADESRTKTPSCKAVPKVMASRANPPHTSSPAQQGLGGHSLAPSPLGPSQAAAVPPAVHFLCLQRSVPSAAKRVPAGTIPQDAETSDLKGFGALGKSRGLHSSPRSCPALPGTSIAITSVQRCLLPREPFPTLASCMQFSLFLHSLCMHLHPEASPAPRHPRAVTLESRRAGSARTPSAHVSCQGNQPAETASASPAQLPHQPPRCPNPPFGPKPC